MKSRQYEGEKSRTPEKGQLKDLNKKKNEKTGLIIGKGLKLIRVKQTHDFSKSRASILYTKLVKAIHKIDNSNSKSIEVED